MKKMLILGGFLVSLGAFSSTIERAEELYELRGEDVNNAVSAEKIYGDLAAVTTDKTEKSQLLLKQSEAIYYVGSVANSKEEKKKIFNRGKEVASSAVSLLEGQVDDFEQEEILAKSYFYFGANLGKWGEAKGIASSAGQAKYVRRAMKKIIDLGQEEVEEYGAHRILGRVNFKLPGILGGDNELAEEQLQEAFENTLNDEGDVSVHGLNNIFYAEVLLKNDKKVRACEILKLFTEQDPEVLLDTRIPETKIEIEQAKKLMAKKCN